ncbi:MAG: GGDEF domain-containing protein [Rhizobacter sp.]
MIGVPPIWSEEALGLAGAAAPAWRLRFDDTTERRFVQDSAEDRLRHFIISGWFTLLVFNVFIVSDWFMVPDVFSLAVVLRVGACAPMALVLWSMQRRRQAWRRRPHAWLEMIMAAQSLSLALVLAALLACTRSPNGYFYHAGYVLVIMMATVAHRLRFVYALALSIAVAVIHMIGVALSPDMPVPLRGALMVLVVAFTAYLLVANFRMEFEERRRYVLRSAEQALLIELQATGARLEALSLTDALTGLANRRRLERYLQEQWQHTAAAAQDLSVLMVDVDHFKAYNDRYGHPTGDECLRHIATELARQIPQDTGLVARWGGEEFIVVLPACTHLQALEAARRLRLGVQSLALRHEDSPTAPMVTVSVGVATREAAAGLGSVKDLVERADQALYAAKAGGRNCVRDHVRDDAG